MNKKYLIGIIQSRGLRNLSYRVWYMLQSKSGILEHRFPTSPQNLNLLSLEEWRKTNRHFLNGRNSVSINKSKDEILKAKANRILEGELQYFSAEWRNIGSDWNWHINPSTGYEYNHTQHWARINELNRASGDIKFVWEPSRFCFIYDIVRYDYHYELDHSNFVIEKILDWIKKNPLNCGPNYKCSQEISLRVLNWLFALNFYKDSENLTAEKWSIIIQSIYWQVHHVYENINFSRYTVRNNHAITETMTLYLMGLMFPTMPGAEMWRDNGKRWFQQEIRYQIAEDGAFVQDSMNYHRVLVQLLSVAICISDKNEDRLAVDVYEKAHKALNFLYQCQDSVSGKLPNYGSNDGALFFPLSTADYRDYRPQLDALHVLLTGKNLYDKNYEDGQWLASSKNREHSLQPLFRKDGIISFEKSGYYIIREDRTLTFVRCGEWNGKQGCTDELHIDVWYKGENVLLDGGSFSYNTEPDIVRYFSGTESHNTVMVEGHDQMLKGPRFVWMYPPTILSTSLYENENEYVFEGSIVAFKQLGPHIIHTRSIRKKKSINEWVVSDKMQNTQNKECTQLWHTASPLLYVENDCCQRETYDAYHSSYYGTKDKCQKIVYKFKDTITTKISIK